MDLFLAIDQSTSATKALLVDGQGRLLDRATRSHEQLYPRPGWVEHDAESIWQNTLLALKDIVERMGTRTSSIRSLSITNQRETVVVFSSQSGKPAHPAMVWQCRRGADLCADLINRGHTETVRDRTGLPLDPYFSASKISHLLAQHPSTQTALATGDLLVGTMDAYLIHRLTEGRVFACDHTNASRTLLFDINRLSWDLELCELWGIPSVALPDPKDCTGDFGETDLLGLLPRRIPIRGVIGDSHASLFAHRCFSPGAAKVTFGTGSSIMINAGTTAPPVGEGTARTLAWVIAERPVFALEGIIICSTATLSWLKSQLGLFDEFREMEALATSVTDNGGVYMVPAFHGLGIPHWKPDARAAILGLSGHSDRRHLIRAGLESIAYQLRDALEAMRAGQTFAISTI
ncbi:MAG: hypothetical protein RL648_336, partial [Verrucomicrobiota bacterium]